MESVKKETPDILNELVLPDMPRLHRTKHRMCA